MVSDQQEDGEQNTYARRIRMVLILLLWGASAYFVGRLAVEYSESGSKEKVSSEIVKVKELEPPWIWISRDIGHTKKCILTLESCFLFVDGEGILCNDAIVSVNWTAAQQVGNLLNSRKLREIGSSMKSTFDELEILFAVSHIDTGDIIPIDEVESTCFVPYQGDLYRSGIQLGTPTRAIAVPIGDDSVIKALAMGEDPPGRSIGTPLWLGLGNFAALSFCLQQEEFLNGTIKNTTLYSTTQISQHPLNILEFRIAPSTFSVTRMMHQPGQSLLDLLGSIFGWLGVLTGACILSLIDMAAAALARYKNVKKKCGTSKKDPLLVDDLEMSMLSDHNAGRQLETENAVLRQELASLRGTSQLIETTNGNKKTGCRIMSI